MTSTPQSVRTEEARELAEELDEAGETCSTPHCPGCRAAAALRSLVAERDRYRIALEEIRAERAHGLTANPEWIDRVIDAALTATDTRTPPSTQGAGKP